MKQDCSTWEQSTSNQCIKSSQHAIWCYEKKQTNPTPQLMPCKKGKFAKSISIWRKTTWGELPLRAARYHLAADRNSCAAVKVRHSWPLAPAALKEAIRTASSWFVWEVMARRSLVLISPSALLLTEVSPCLGQKARMSPAAPWAPGHHLTAAGSSPAGRRLPPEPNSAVELGSVYPQRALEMNQAALQQGQRGICCSWLSLRRIKLVWESRQEANPSGEKYCSSTRMPSPIWAWHELMLKPCLLIWIFTDYEKFIPALFQEMSKFCLANKKK